MDVTALLLSRVQFAFTISFHNHTSVRPSSLAFMVWGEGLFVFPLMLLYKFISYRVFRGKAETIPGHY
jgi:cytochrome d ubiquinol oxidase subunit II